MLAELWTQLDKGAVVVTPTARLAYYLRKTQEAKNSTIVSVPEWLRYLWELYTQKKASDCTRISTWQSRVIWQDLILQEDLPLLRTQAVVNQVQQAWQLVQQWQIPFESIIQSNTDSQLFIRWAHAYAEICQDKGWVDEAQLPQFLASHLHSISAKFYLYGFDYVTPQLRTLCQRLQATGSQVCEHILTKDARAQLSYYQYPDAQSEWRAAAQWAKEHQEQRVAIVIPELASQWSKVQRIFTEVLAPEQLISGDIESPKPFNLDAGLPFTEYPLVADTLILLRWLAKKLPYAEAGSLLRSLFWPDSESEFIHRAQLMVKLAKNNYHELSLFALIKFLQTDPEQPVRLLLLTLEQIKQIREQWPNKASPSEWIQLLKQLFVQIKWAQSQLIHKAEQQIWQRWEIVLDEIASLDVVLSEPISYGQLLKLILQNIQAICFQPESGLARIQVMGILETSGMPFTHLWVCGLHAQTWPAPPQPNPFIPAQLQRQYAVPHGSYAQELLYSQQFTEQWMSAAQELICSYPERAGDVEMLPSAVIKDRVKDILKQPPTLHNMPVKRNTKALLRKDEGGLPCKEIKATVGLLQDQAECPFRAYAYHRLGLAQHKLAVPESLGNALMRGLVVHRALQLIWGAIKDHQQLRTLSEDELAQLLDNKIQQTLQEHYGIQSDGGLLRGSGAVLPLNREARLCRAQRQNKKAILGSFSPGIAVPEIFMQVEHERVHGILLKWLAKEKLRDKFRVHRLEHTLKLDLSGMTLHLRIDRIDQLENGTYVIVDYKTAKLPSMSFIPERLTYPQLPLYALSKPEKLAAVVFAQVSGEQIGFSGWVDESNSGELPKINSKSLVVAPFAQQLQAWQQQLDALAQEYQQGYAKVEPYPNETTCRYCDLHLLCRVGQHDH